MPWLEIIGWIGSALVVWSLTLSRVLRFRWMNLIGSTIAAGYNAAIGVWPFFAMNAIIAVINVYWLIRLYRESHDSAVYEVVQVDAEDAYLRHVLRVHAGDIEATHPGFDNADSAGQFAWLVVRGDETVGVVVVQRGEDATGLVQLDWVSPRFRDFTPGQFVYERSGIFEQLGLQQLVFRAPPASAEAYLKRVGFVAAGNDWVRPVA